LEPGSLWVWQLNSNKSWFAGRQATEGACMSEEKKQEQWAIASNSAMGPIACNRLLAPMGLDQRVLTLEDLVLEATKELQDEAAIGYLILLERAYKERVHASVVVEHEYQREFTSLTKAAMEVNTCLALIFFGLPLVRIEHHAMRDADGDHAGYEERGHPVLSKFRTLAVERIGHLWKIAEHEGTSLAAFRFLCVAVSGKAESSPDPSLPWVCPGGPTGEASLLALHQVDEILRQSHIPDAGRVDFWLKLPKVPDDIGQMLALARTRSTGKLGVLRDMEREELLLPLYTGKDSRRSCSDGALDTLREFVARLTVADNTVKALVESMSVLDWSWGEVGKSEYVPAEFTWVLRPDLQGVDLIVALQDSIIWANTPGLIEDVQGRIRRAVHAWWEKQKTIDVISITCTGGPVEQPAKVYLYRSRS